ncbi:MAG: hypothetical protein P4M12_07300 [Gammaproteobacteria bacterium]|nr:hypothetical protein [Gammaproteobacteria bacterium]
MAILRDQQGVLKKLRNQIKLLKQKEKVAHKKLHAALSNAKRMTKAYETQLEKNTRKTKAKIVAVYKDLADSITKKAKRVKVSKSIVSTVRKSTKK